MISCINDTIETVRQSINLLVEMPLSIYQRTDPPVYEYGIGAHLRHNIDHFHSFLNGLENGRVDYDLRNRDGRLERDPEVASSVLAGIIAALSELTENDMERSLLVKLDGGQDASWSQSTTRRELQFLLSHTVHHYALIAMICRINGQATPPNFGVAPSTVKHRENERSQACAH